MSGTTGYPQPPYAITCHGLSERISIVDIRDRYDELNNRDALARAIAAQKAQGKYEPGGHVSEENFPPVTVDEHLEMLACGEHLARYYRHSSQVN